MLIDAAELDGSSVDTEEWCTELVLRYSSEVLSFCSFVVS